MSLKESSPSANPFGEVTPHDPKKVAGFRQLVERFKVDEAPTEITADPLSAEVDTSDSSDPMFEQLFAETVAKLSPSEPNVERSSSRLANLLRSSARGVETTAEKWDDTKLRAKKRLGRIGRAALSFAVAGGELVEGARVVATDKMLEVADRADDKLFNAVDSAKESAKSAAINTGLRAETAVKNGMGKVEAGMDTVGTKMIELSDSVKERLAALKSAAIARRMARRERWAGRVNSVRETARNTKDAVAETTERARQKRDALRAIGRVAIDARAER